jgi:hypothetical protein
MKKPTAIGSTGNTPWFRLVSFTLMLASGLGASDAYAIALYTAQASATLTVESIENLTNPGDLTGLTVDAYGGMVRTDEVFFGNASASGEGFGDENFGNFPALQEGDSISQEASTSGNTGAGGGFASSFAGPGDGFFEIFNNSPTATFALSLTLDYTLRALASETRVGESAGAVARVSSLVSDELGPVATRDGRAARSRIASPCVSPSRLGILRVSTCK